MNTDYAYLSDLVAEFFAKKAIRDKLNIIHEWEISGWEVWLQIEFAAFLAYHTSEPEWQRECTLAIDRRRDKNRFTLRPDFVLRKKGWAKDRFLALEMKLHPLAKSCVHNMMADFKKLSKMKVSALDVRSFWGLGLFLTPHDEEPLDKIIDSKAEEWGVNVTSSDAEFATIKGTRYSYVLM